MSAELRRRSQLAWGTRRLWLVDERAAYRLAGRFVGVAGGASLVALVSGALLGLMQGRHDVSQLGMLHLPAAWLATLLLLSAVFWSAVGLILDRSLPYLLAQAVVPTGGMFTFLTLWSGALWARAAEGVWWIGDPRQVAELVMFLVYLTLLALCSVLPCNRYSDRLLAVVALFGGAVVVTLFFLMEGWRQLIGPAQNAPPGDPGLLAAAVLVAAGLWCYATYVGLIRLRCLIKERELGLTEFLATR